MQQRKVSLVVRLRMSAYEVGFMSHNTMIKLKSLPSAENFESAQSIVRARADLIKVRLNREEIPLIRNPKIQSHNAASFCSAEFP